MIAANGAGPSLAIPSAVSDLELQLLLEGVMRLSGYDFREYAPAFIRRRIAERLRAEGVATISGLQERVLHGPDAMERLVQALTQNPSTPFAEPDLFGALRANVVPRLKTFPFARIWVAGCGAGDDAYALAIMLREAEMGHRVRIYATAAAEGTVEEARTGRLVAADLPLYEQRYAQAGGTRRFADYVELRDGELRYRAGVREAIVFAQHNLATDGSFNEFHLILVHHALTHFNRALAYRVHQLLFESLVRLGVLTLGAGQTLRYTPHERAYERLAGTESAYRRVR